MPSNGSLEYLRLVAKLSVHIVMDWTHKWKYKHSEHDCEHSWLDRRYTLEIWWKHDNILLNITMNIHHHAVFYAGAARCSKTVSNHCFSLFCVPLSIQSALSLGKFINYECWVEDPHKDFLLLKCSCFSKYTWDILRFGKVLMKPKYFPM